MTVPAPQSRPPAASTLPSRIGSVPYLNAAPLTWGLEGETAFLPPSRLARELHEGRIDAALLSVTEVLLEEGYGVLDGVAIGSDGPVASVFLAHQDPLDSLGVVHLDPASCTSVQLLRILLAERGARPALETLRDPARAREVRNLLLIGNPAIAFRRTNPPHRIWDLGAAWRESTGLPFVYAAWVIRRGASAGVAGRLREAAAAGLAALPQIIDQRPEFDREFRRAYLGGHIRYGLGDREKAGLARFGELLARHTGRQVQPVRYLGA